jgi:preprotein translocase subunit SecG
VFAAVCIIALVLVQQGKGAAMGAAFGSGASQTVFGSRGSGSFLFRLTISFIVIFFITSLSMNYLASHAFKQEKVIVLPAPPARSMPMQPVKTPALPATSEKTLAVPAQTEQTQSVQTQTVPAATLPIAPASQIPTRKK